MARALLSAGFIAAALAAAMPAAAIELPTGIDSAAQGTSSTPSPRRLAVGAGVAVAPDYQPV
jgi:hypothetical protein